MQTAETTLKFVDFLRLQKFEQSVLDKTSKVQLFSEIQQTKIVLYRKDFRRAPKDTLLAQISSSIKFLIVKSPFLTSNCQSLI